MSHRQRLARILTGLQLDRLALRLRSRRLFVLTYHRVLRIIPHDYPFDDGVVEHTAKTFEAQVRWLARHTLVLTEKQLLSIAHGQAPPPGPLSMITVDDAYVDAYEVVHPILRRVGVPAIFFVPVEPVQRRRLPWWDRAAWALKRCARPSIEFEGLTMRPKRPHDVVALFQSFKQSPSSQEERVEALARACGVELPPERVQDGELLSWDQVRALARADMTIGAHTMTHRVLDTLTEAERSEELCGPRRVFERELGRTPRSIAFPGAGKAPISRSTTQAARDAGYELGFLPYGGVTDLGGMDTARVRRIDAPSSLAALRAQLAYPRLFM